MEDRYLHKAKRLDNGEWVIGFYTYIHEKHYIYTGQLMHSGLYDVAERFEVDPSTICQCTGSKDKNGKLIWENDIIQHRDSDEIRKAYIKYSAPFFVLHSTLGIYSSDTLADFSKIEVVGNIFDNPELLGRNDK